MKSNYFTFLIITVMAISCSQNKQLTEEEALKMKLVGTWQLIAYADFDTVKKVWTNPYGLHPKGYFTYTKSGIVNLNISSEEPLKIAADSAKSI